MLTIGKTAERSTTLTGRRIQAEELYDTLYTRFKTHNFGFWVDPDDENVMFAVPPYCYRFDEYLGVIIGLTGDITPSLNRLFPNPDPLELLYIEDTLFLLDKAIGEGPLYTCTKGSDMSFLPKSYRDHVSRVYAWLEAKNQTCANTSSSTYEFDDEQSPSLKTPNQHALLLSTKLFRNGFTLEKLTELLITLGILTEANEHTVDSKPRNWRAVIEALRESKYLVYNQNTNLFSLLQEHYTYPYKIRAIQGSFSAKNSDTEIIYKRAHQWCVAAKQ